MFLICRSSRYGSKHDEHKKNAGRMRKLWVVRCHFLIADYVWSLIRCIISKWQSYVLSNLLRMIELWATRRTHDGFHGFLWRPLLSVLMQFRFFFIESGWFGSRGSTMSKYIYIKYQVQIVLCLMMFLWRAMNVMNELRIHLESWIYCCYFYLAFIYFFNAHALIHITLCIQGLFTENRNKKNAGIA